VAVPRARLTVQGEGFAKRKPGSIRFAKARPASFKTDRQGAFSVSLPVPAGIVAAPSSPVVTLGKVRVRLPVRVEGSAPAASSVALVSSRGPRVLVSPLSGQRFSRVEINGRGYRPDVRVDVTFGRYRVGTARTGPTGSFALLVGVPQLSVGGQQLAVSARRASFSVPYSVSPPPLPRPLGGDPLLAAAGDIACVTGRSQSPSGCQQTATAALIDAISPTVVAPLGDLQYESGALQDFQGSFDATWGAFRAIMRPVPGNHEYMTHDAAGYFGYFGAGAGGSLGAAYYSYDVGAWHLIALDSNCRIISGGCGAGSPQESWLRSDLATHPNRCTLAYWHHPLFDSDGAQQPMQDIWGALHDGGADVVLAGHEHAYERLAPQTAAGLPDPIRGIRSFVVGTGGKSHSGFSTPMPTNGEVRNNTSFGILKLSLHPSSYDWQFIPIAGASFTDSGSAACH
jgi:hypothetical protein